MRTRGNTGSPQTEQQALLTSQGLFLYWSCIRRPTQRLSRARLCERRLQAFVGQPHTVSGPKFPASRTTSSPAWSPPSSIERHWPSVFFIVIPSTREGLATALA